MEDPGVIYCHFKAPKRRISLEHSHSFAERWFAKTLPAAIGSLMWDMFFSVARDMSRKTGGAPLTGWCFSALKVLIGRIGGSWIHCARVSQISLTWQVPICDQVNGMAWKWKCSAILKNDFWDTAPLHLTALQQRSAFLHQGSCNPRPLGKKEGNLDGFCESTPLLIKHNWLELLFFPIGNILIQ